MSARYAIYFAPALHSVWCELGVRWLQPETEPAGSEVTGFTPAEWMAITSAPRRYGFHATLKAPFRLAPGCGVEQLTERLHALAATLQPVALGPMQLVTLGNFVALTPVRATHALAALAARCVTQLDDLRAPLSQDDLARRQVDGLDAREKELLHLYGYPYVLERFRLHLSLSGPVDTATAQRVLQALSGAVARANLSVPLVLDRLCLFVEPAPGADFRRELDVELGA